MSSRRNCLKQIAKGVMAVCLFPLLKLRGRSARSRPNILWLSCEDIGPHLKCYGYTNAVTPHLDTLAREGVLFENAFTVAGVCAPNRSSIITGIYASSLGTQNMRAGGEGVKRSSKPHLPEMVKCFSEYLRDAGYYCTNNFKEDYNFVTPDTAWDDSSRDAHWRNRPANSPFFAVFNYTGTHEGSIRLDEERRVKQTERLHSNQRQKRESQELPSYYPDTEVTREYWARYHELITTLDYWIGDRLKELEEANLKNETIVFFWSDHGAGMPRAKRWIYDSGTHIPLFVRVPKKFRQENQGTPGTRDDQLVSSLDFAPTVLNLAVLPIPDYMQGRPFIGSNLPSERQYVFSIRDRMDERYDLIRSVRDKKYRYVSNYMSHKPYYQYIQSAERGPVMQEIRRLEQEGELPETVALYTSKSKPREELYDVHNDPHEINNLASDPAYKDILKKMHNVQLQWMLETKDLGLIPEPEILRLEKECGSRYAILQQPDSENSLRRLHKTAVMAGKPEAVDLHSLLSLLKDENPSIRYWALIGLGNLGNEAQGSLAEVRKLLDDTSPTVRVAAAETLCKLGEVSAALPILKMELRSDEEWIRLHAAIVIDELGEEARSAIQLLQAALDDQDNKYVVRVANHAINNLLGTNHQVR